MAKVTSSKDRSKRTASKRPTSSATRATRSKASTNSSKMTESGKGVTKGSASSKVTTSKPTTSPRAITNGKSPAMRQLRAKAVQANRQAQGKPVQGGTKGRAFKLPNSAARGTNLIKAGADKARVIGDSGKVRAAQSKGSANVDAAKRRRARMAAGYGKPMAGASTAKALGKVGVLGAVAAVGINAGKVADGTLKNKPMRKPSGAPSSKEKATGADFGKSFKKARSEGSKVFMFKGKKYNTKRKDGK